jgi:hypothetical protein
MSKLQILLASKTGASTPPPPSVTYTPPFEIGQELEGGYYAGTYCINGDNVPSHLLVLSDKIYRPTAAVNWYTGTTTETVSSNSYDGYTNTNNFDPATHPLVQHVKNLNISGYSDWYIPSKYELLLIMENFPDGARNGYGNIGENPYKFLKLNTNYPDGKAYSGGGFDPRWKSGGSQVINSNLVYSSTEDSSTHMVGLFTYTSGGYYSQVKQVEVPGTDYQVLPIRRIPYSTYFPNRVGNLSIPYRYWKWKITGTIAGNSYPRLSEFALQYDQMDVNLKGRIATTNGFVSETALSPQNIIDGGDAYTYENFMYSSSTGMYITIDLGYAQSFTGYRWRTASEAGDPQNWTVEASNDNTNWTIIDTKTSYTVTGGRSTWQPPVHFPAVVYPPQEFGESFGGGYYAGLYSSTGDGVPTHFLVVSPKTTGQSTLAWDPDLNTAAGSTSTSDGLTNSNSINDSSHPAAQFCRGLSIGGYTDWYLPSWYELQTVYNCLKPYEINSTTTGTNGVVPGINPYAVIPHPNVYNAAIPSAVQNSSFRSGGAEAFNEDFYWTSTQITSTKARIVDFYGGRTYDDWKDSGYLVRAIRKVPYFTVSAGTSRGPYRYWRWRITGVRSTGDGAQAAELRFQFNGINIPLYGASITSVGGGSASEDVRRLISGNLDEKWYADTIWEPSNSTPIIATIDLVNSRSFTGYQWATANDATDRDPSDWTIEGSNDNSSWAVVHTVTGYSATTARNTWQTAWNFS